MPPKFTFTKRWNKNKVIGKLFNSLSLLFIPGEKYFIKALEQYKESLYPHLQGRLEQFKNEELNHSHVHHQFNKTMTENWSKIYADVEKTLDENTACPKQALINTVILEEITGFGAHIVPLFSWILLRGDKEAKRMWLWHAKEERQHYTLSRKIAKEVGVSNWEITKEFPRVGVFLLKQIVRNYRSLSNSQS